MRNLIFVALLAATALAGCADEGGDDTLDVPDTGLETPALTASHPSYNFTTADALLEGNATHFPGPGEFNRNDPPGVTAWRKPVQRDLPDILSSIEFQTRTAGGSGAAGIAVFGPLAFAGPTSGPMDIINILEPGSPSVIATIDVPARDIDTILYPDGRLIVVSTGGGSQLYFTDVTDPYDPVLVGQLETPNGNHNMAVVPGTPIVYNSPSDGVDAAIDPLGLVNDPTADPSGETDIIDASDPEDPVLVQTWQNGYGCHDLTFLMNQSAQKYRGYCAGLEALQIWDIADPLDPQVITEFGWPLAGVHDTTSASIVSFAHLAMPNHDGTILILGDETGGGAAPGCDFSVHEPTTGTTVTGPLGNLWFYDISDEQNPILKGSVSPNAIDQRGSCTAHFGKVIEDRDHVVMGFYSAGVVLVDFTDPQNPYIKDAYTRPTPVLDEGQGAGTIWDVWYYQGYLFTGDTQNGVDVLTLD